MKIPKPGGGKRKLHVDRTSTRNVRGPWFNAGASHKHAASPKAYFDDLCHVSLLDLLRINATTSTTGTAVKREPCIRWWETERGIFPGLLKQGGEVGSLWDALEMKALGTPWK